jgi:hypothetical protein
MYLRATQGYGSLIPGSEYIRSLVRQGTVSKEAAKRLQWMDHYGGAWQRPADLPVLRDKPPDLLPVEEPV